MKFARRAEALLRLRRLGLLVLATALTGEAGHQLFQRLHATVAHHLFHLVFAGGAVVVFAAYVALDIRANGWPAFSWRLGPERPGSPSGRTDGARECSQAAVSPDA